MAFAKAQVGKPYIWAAAGPNAYDCSGLTMAAWGKAGVVMAHGSRDQYADFPKVSSSQLQPGDLVLFYSDMHHVGIYVGNGMVIHAGNPRLRCAVHPDERDARRGLRASVRVDPQGFRQLCRVSDERGRR